MDTETKPKEYYIVSLKHTSKGDTALLFWCENGGGYSLDRAKAGVYIEDQLPRYTDSLNVAVLKEDADKFWANALDFNDKFVSIPNSPTVRHHLNLDDKKMKPKKFASQRMTFLNTPLES